MELSKEVKQLADDLGLNMADASIMELKAKLYIKSADLIKVSKLSHEEIAKKIGISKARITRICNMGENNVSIELLTKLVGALC